LKTPVPKIDTKRVWKIFEFLKLKSTRKNFQELGKNVGRIRMYFEKELGMPHNVKQNNVPYIDSFARKYK